MITIHVASVWAPKIGTQLERIFSGHDNGASFVFLQVVDKEAYIDAEVPELEDEEFSSKIEVMLADVPVLAKYSKKLTNLKWVHTFWNGVDILMNSLDKDEPLPTYVLTKTPGSVNAALITEYVIGYIIATERSFFMGKESQNEAEWNQASISRKTHSLSARSIGIIGVGGIGKHLAKICKAFGMTVWGLTRRSYTPETGCPYVDEYRTADQLPDVLRNCHYICNILPSTPSSRNMLSGDVLRHCESKKSVFINVGRGDVIDEDSIVKAIKNGWLGGAILDVFQNEPLPKTSPLWSLPNVIITPHTSGWSATENHMKSVLECFAKNYQRYVEGRPLEGILDWSQGY